MPFEASGSCRAEIEEGEDATAAACREAEELGITIEVMESLGDAEDLDHTQPEHHVKVELLLAPV